jgi:hypothetical protein
MESVRAEKRTLHPAWFGVLAAFGFLTCLRPRRWRETAPLWLSLVIFLGIIFGIGDALTRYLQPVDWIGVVLVGLGLDWLLGLVWRPAPEKPAPAAAAQS